MTAFPRRQHVYGVFEAITLTTSLPNGGPTTQQMIILGWYLNCLPSTDLVIWLELIGKDLKDLAIRLLIEHV